MKLVPFLLKNSWKTVALAAFMSSLSGASSAGIIALINFTLKNMELPTAPLVWSFVGFCCLLLITNTLSDVLLTRLTEGIIFKLQLSLTQRLLACPLQHLEAIGSPRLLAALTEDIDNVSFASADLTTLFTDFAVLAYCLIYLTWLSVTISVFFFIFIILGIFSYKILIRPANQALKLARETQDRLFQHFRTITEGTKELKLHRQRRQAFISEDLQLAAASLQHHRVKAMTNFAFASSWGLVLFFIPIGLMIFFFPKIANIPVSVLSSYTLTIIFIMSPLRRLVDVFPRLSRGNIALENLEHIGLSLVAQNTEPKLTTPLEFKTDWASLELVGVTHTYYREREESRFILGPIDLSFHPGEIVFLIGGNGSGKSTLVKLLTALYIPETGVIQVDGKTITDTNREWYRQMFSVVFSDFYLFERLLGLGNSDLDSQTQEYLVQLQLDHKVQVKEGVLSTTALSQGQRKRLALLTAYLEDRPIYVFDEWASDQDPIFKKIFYTKLLPELKNQGKTVLVVSHDDQYFDLGDRIVKLDYGKVVYEQRLRD